MLGELFYRSPRLTLLTIGLAVVAGLSALGRLPRQEDPTLSRRFAVVTTFLPGASARRVETLVTDPIEDELRELHELKEIRSFSRNGVSLVTLELQDRYGEKDVDAVWSKARDRIEDARRRLPATASAPRFEDRTTVATTVVVGLVAEPAGEVDLALLSRLAEELEARLETLPHTRETRLYGEAEEEVRVTAEPDVLAALGLTAEDLARHLARADAKAPAGELQHPASELPLEVAGELDSIQRIRAVPVRSLPNGRVLRVGDIARVERAVRTPPASLALVDGQPGVLVSATMNPGFRVDQWAARARERIAAFEGDLPRGVRLRTLFDQSIYTEQRLSQLARNLGLGAGIVGVVTVLSLGLRSAAVVSAALPLSLAMALAGMLALGVPLHQTSVTGLIIALGLLIDNAIVVVDDLATRLRGGTPAPEAVRGAVEHLFVPLLASTLTTAFAFLPIVIAPGPVGEFVGPISTGVILSVTSSFLLAMTVIPALAARFRVAAPESGGPWWRGGLRSRRVLRHYRRLLDLVIARPAAGVAISLVLPAAGFAVAPRLGEQFFPPNDRNQFQVQLRLPGGSSLERTRLAALRATRLLRRHPEVTEAHFVVGDSPPRVFYNMIDAEEGLASFAGGFITTRSAEATERLLPGLQRELREAFPEALALALPFEQGPPFRAPLEVRVVGPDLALLREVGERIRRRLAGVRAVTYTATGLAPGEPEVELDADEDAVRAAGLALRDLSDGLRAALDGAVGGSVLEDTEALPVRVQAPEAWRRDLWRVLSTPVGFPGRPPPSDPRRIEGAPLAALARPLLVPALGGIPRKDGERENTVQAFLEPYALISASLAEFRAALRERPVLLPAGYRIEFGGEDEERSEALASMLAYAGPLFVVMAGAVILSLDSFRLASVIFLVGLLSVGLALFGVFLFGHPLGFLAIVGTLGLVGLAINGAIIVLAALRADPRARAGDPAAIREVVVGATRHILATTLTTVGGFVPLIAYGGRFWPPLATAIAGGVAGSAVLSLILVPALFVWLRAGPGGIPRPAEGGR